MFFQKKYFCAEENLLAPDVVLGVFTCTLHSSWGYRDQILPVDLESVKNGLGALLKE